MILSAISLWQPYASFLVWGVKGPETRSWKPPEKYIGKPVLIHASKRPLPMLDEIPDNGTIHALEIAGRTLSDLRFGAILGVGTLAAVYRSEDTKTAMPHEFELARAALAIVGCYPVTPLHQLLGNYADGRYAWVFEELREFPEPIPFRGAQGFFNVELPDEIAERYGIRAVSA